MTHSPRRKLPRVFRRNCLVFILGLLLTGRLKCLVFRLRGMHFLGLTHRGNFIHFRGVPCRPPLWKRLWFTGTVELLRPQAFKRIRS